MSDPTATPPADPPADQPAGEPTKADLEARARELDVAGRSKMDRDELIAAIADAEAAHDPSQIASTPEQIGRPPLAEVAEQDAIDRAPHKVIGEPHPAYADGTVSDAQEG